MSTNSLFNGVADNQRRYISTALIGLSAQLS